MYVTDWMVSSYAGTAGAVLELVAGRLGVG
jgi:hypothetical protein